MFRYLIVLSSFGLSLTASAEVTLCKAKNDIHLGDKITISDDSQEPCGQRSYVLSSLYTTAEVDKMIEASNKKIGFLEKRMHLAEEALQQDITIPVSAIEEIETDIKREFKNQIKAEIKAELLNELKQQ